MRYDEEKELLKQAINSRKLNETDPMYQLQHNLLKKLFYEDTRDIVNYLLKNKDSVYLLYVNACNATKKKAKYIKTDFDLKIYINKNTEFVFNLQFPIPERCPLCQNIYLVINNDCKPIGYWTVEKSMTEEEPIICVWESLGKHINYGTDYNLKEKLGLNGEVNRNSVYLFEDLIIYSNLKNNDEMHNDVEDYHHDQPINENKPVENNEPFVKEKEKTVKTTEYNQQRDSGNRPWFLTIVLICSLVLNFIFFTQDGNNNTSQNNQLSGDYTYLVKLLKETKSYSNFYVNKNILSNPSKTKVLVTYGGKGEFELSALSSSAEVEVEWGDWIDDDTCELFITAKQPGIHYVDLTNSEDTHLIKVLIINE